MNTEPKTNVLLVKHGNGTAMNRLDKTRLLFSSDREVPVRWESEKSKTKVTVSATERRERMIKSCGIHPATIWCQPRGHDLS